MEVRVTSLCCRCMSVLKSQSHPASVSLPLIQRRFAHQKQACHYEVLNLPKDASPEDIKEAFLKLSKETHPDINRHDPKTGERFGQIMEAYRILSKPSLRQEYDLQSMWNRHNVHNIHPPRTYQPQDRNPGDDDYEILYKRATDEFVHVKRATAHTRKDNTQVILYLLGVVAFGGLLALGTIQFHYKTRKSETENIYRRNQASYREEQALRLAHGSKMHKQKVLQKLAADSEQKKMEYDAAVGVAKS